VKLHLGCGTYYLTGYVNVDIRTNTYAEVYDDIRFLNKFKDKEISEIYACHVLEHFTIKETPAIIKKWFDTLQPQGKLIISIPDMGKLIEQYNETKNLKELIPAIYGGAKL